LFDCRLGAGPVRVLHKRKATGPARFAIQWPHDLRWLADLREMRSQVVFSGLVREISYE
jgi:hypothetical protein